MKKMFYSLLVLLIALGFSTGALAADRFKWITSTDKVGVYYDTQTIQYNSGYSKTVDVWIKWKYTEEGARDYVERQRAKGYCQKEAWDNYSHVVEHWILNANNQRKLMEQYYYDRDGHVIYSDTSSTDWRPIVPNTIGENIYNTFRPFLKSQTS